MATRGTIALEYADGTIEQIYSHWDNYIEHNGKILFQHYSDPFKLQQLLDLGSISSLAPEIGEQHPFDNPHRYGTPEFESFRQQYDHMTLFYARDRGEDLHVNRYDSYQDYLDRGQFEEYNYILRPVDGVAVWYVSDGGDFKKLETFVKKIIDKKEST